MSISIRSLEPSLHAGFTYVAEALGDKHWIDHLSDGTPILIRPLQAGDRDLETDFIRDLSPKSRRLRFHCNFKQPSEALIDQLMNLDYQKRTAFIALIHDKGKLREIGVSRYCATAEEHTCESAVTVADDWLNRGLGTLLMRHLIDEARRNGFKRMVSMDSASNQAMSGLARHLGFERRLDPADPSQAIHTLNL
ncbi:GNAT family N-acetyltransferase [Dyella halodurans]|uniref:GNAT family N-acetyltransferase n=1 Tax=Dyella halodurans TaxID=1920171 RepID=A0ABV9C1X6_9GAMM|nr:GNAT family N-acetyltransferase [Dyella halodurans]